MQEEIEKPITYSGRLNVVELYPRQISMIQFLSPCFLHGYVFINFFVKLIILDRERYLSDDQVSHSHRSCSTLISSVAA